MAAKVEASSAYRGIGIVKLMGRQSGFIAMQVCCPPSHRHLPNIVNPPPPPSFGQILWVLAVPIGVRPCQIDGAPLRIHTPTILHSILPPCIVGVLLPPVSSPRISTMTTLREQGWRSEEPTLGLS